MKCVPFKMKDNAGVPSKTSCRAPARNLTFFVNSANADHVETFSGKVNFKMIELAPLKTVPSTSYCRVST